MPHSDVSFGYNDQYATCVETFSTLRIFSDHVGAERVTSILALQPTTSFTKGEAYGTHGHRRKSNGWLFSTEGLSDSKDTRRHIDIILSALSGKASSIDVLKRAGVSFDICSYWVSTGQGGPALWPHQMKALGELGIEVWWDIYFAAKDEA